MPTYTELLRDPRWQRKRLEILERDEWKCTDCGDETSNLQVHHRRYLYGKMPWEVPGKWLETLCESCHYVATKNGNVLKDAIAELPPSSLGFVIGYVRALAAARDANHDIWPGGSWEYCAGVAHFLGVIDDEVLDIEMSHSGDGPMDLSELAKVGGERAIATRKKYLRKRTREVKR